jgi:uncharacterized membrane protein YoaK (UPF0700 family)
MTGPHSPRSRRSNTAVDERTTVRSDTKVALAALSIATGSLDVSAFLRLGGVFASSMTSNLIFVSLAAVKADASLGQHCATALLGYVAGVGIGSVLAKPAGRESQLGGHRLSILFTAETVLLTAYAAWWSTEGARPNGWQQLILLGVVTFAMGVQGAALAGWAIPMPALPTLPVP